VKLLVTIIIFPKETMSPSLTSSAPDSSQNFSPGVEKKLWLLIKRSIVDRFCWKLAWWWSLARRIFWCLEFGKIFTIWAKNLFFMKIFKIEILPICRTFNLNSMCLNIYETWPFNKYKKLDGTSFCSGDMGSPTGQPTFCYLGKNPLYSLDFLNIKSHKITK
jgi:hypothetical protein